MRRIPLFFLLFFVSLASTAQAIPVRYSITSGNDSLGNMFSGFVDIEENATVIDDYIKYTISSFEFTSAGGDFSGNSGYFEFMAGPFPDHISTNDAISRFTGTNGDIWCNDSTGVWFYDEFDQELGMGGVALTSSYATLAPQIRIFMDCLDDTLAYKPDTPSYVWLTREIVPVPEPSTLALLCFGLLIFFIFVRKFGSKQLRPSLSNFFGSDRNRSAQSN